MKSRTVTLYCTEEEYREFRDRAAYEDISVSTYLRRQLMRGPIGGIGAPQWMGEAVAELRKIGNLLNQIAAVANSTGRIDAERYSLEVKQLREVIQRMERPQKDSAAMEYILSKST